MDNKTGLAVKEHADVITDECHCKEITEPDVKSFRHDQTLPQAQSEIKSSSAAPVSASNVKQHVGKVYADASTNPGAFKAYPSNFAKDYQSSHELSSVYDTRGDSLRDIESGIVKQETMVPIAAQVVEEDKDVTEMLDTRIRAEVERLEELMRRQMMTEAAQADIVTSPTQIVNDEHPKGHCASMKRPKVVISLGIVFLLVLISIIVSVVVVTSKKQITSSSLPSTASTPATNVFIIGFYKWSRWSISLASVPINLNLAVAFSGEVNVTTALSKSSGVLYRLNGNPYLGVGGGNATGRWTSEAVTDLNSAIAAGQLGAYRGICYVIEQGDSGLSQAFADSFAMAKQYGFMVLVTISHSALYGVSDARTLMLDFFANTNIDYISPQLYTSGKEAQNDYTAYIVTWPEYNQSHALIVPSIVLASYYSDAQTYFSSQGVTLSGYIQWKN